MKKKEQEILIKVLQEIKPDEKLISKAKEFLKKLNAELKKLDINAEAVLGGSMAKNTFLKKDYDVDVFVKFDKTYKGQNISNILEKALKKYEYERVHGSRDYFHIELDALYELVPALNVNNIAEAENVIDMSPMHVEYFNTRNKNNLNEEVRLLKKFMKASNVYGAESHIKGFSGHVVDLLILKYGSFLEVLKATKKWTQPIIIDLEKKCKDPLMTLNKAKITGPMIIIDPVQENRNAAAALETPCFEKFVKKSQEFLKNPSEDFFKEKTAEERIQITQQELKKSQEDAELIILGVKTKKGKKDVLGSKILKIITHLENELKKHDFKTIKYEWDLTNIYFLIKKQELSKDKIIKGPPITEQEHVTNFLKKHKETFEKNKVMYAKQKRTYKTPFDLIKIELKTEYIKEKCDSIILIKKN